MLKDEVRDGLFGHPDGISKGDLAEELGKTQKQIHRDLYRMRELGEATYSDDGFWYPVIAERPEGAAAPTTVMPPHRRVSEPPPDLRDAFWMLGDTVNMPEPLLSGVCDYVFAGDPEDLVWVWEALNNMGIRIDVARRWYRMWSMQIRRPIPEQIKQFIDTAEEEERKKKGEGASGPKKMKFTVVGDRMLPDPDGDFDTPGEAMKFMALSGAHKPSSGAQDFESMARAMGELTKDKGGPIIDIAAIMREMKPEKKDNSELLTMFQMIFDMQANQAPPEPKKDVLGQIITFVQAQPAVIGTTLGLVRRALGVDALEAQIKAMGTNPQQGATMVKIGDGDGAIPLGDYRELQNINFEIEQKRAVAKRDEEKHNANMGMFSALREKIPQMVTAAERSLARYEQKNLNPPKGRGADDVGQPQTLEGYCPTCAQQGKQSKVTAPASNPITKCSVCGTAVGLDMPPGEGDELSEEERERVG